jgi:hypothetical protein
VIVLVFSLVSLFGGGGFFIGLILGIVGGILAIVWKPMPTYVYSPYAYPGYALPYGYTGYPAAYPGYPGYPGYPPAPVPPTAATPAPAAAPRTCPACSAAVPTTAAYCMACGTRLPRARGPGRA